MVIAGVVALVIVVVVLVHFAVFEWAHRAKRRELWIRPAAQVLIDNLPKSSQDSETGQLIQSIASTIRDNPEKFIELPEVFPINSTDLDSFVTVKLPVSPGSNERAKDRIVTDIGSRLGFDSVPTAHWDYVGHGATVRLYPTPSFGEARTVFDYLPAINSESDCPTRVVLGLDLDGNPVVYDHVTMGPHIKASAGSGGGKSNLYRFLVPQYIRSGAQVVILDVKGVSMLDLAVALEFRNIKYYSEAKTCHDAFQAVFAELERRRQEDIRCRLEGRKAEFAPLHVIMEEANTLMAMLRDFWEYAKQTYEEAARHSPAIRSMHYSVYMGREFGIYIHVIAQRAEANVFGGGAVRENFNAALMSKWDQRTWKMLAHGHKYIPHPMDWSWYLVTSTGVTRYLPPVLQESDARLIADLDNVPVLEWAPELEAVPDVRVSSSELPQRVADSIDEFPHIELAVTMTLEQCREFMVEHGHEIPLSTMKQWQAGARSAIDRGYSLEWPKAVGNNGRAKVYKRTDIIEFMLSGPSPQGKFWDGAFIDIQRSHIELREHSIYGLRVPMYADGIGYIGQTHQVVDTRFEQHKGDQYWGDEIESIVTIFSGVMTCIEARKIEAMLTEVKRPVLNRPIPQVGAEIAPVWNGGAIQLDILKRERASRDIERGREPFKPLRDR